MTHRSISGSAMAAHAFIACAFVLFAAPLPLGAQSATSPATQPTTQPSTQPAATEDTSLPSPEDIQAQLAQVEAATNLSAEHKQEITRLLKAAIEQLGLISSWEQRVAESQNRIRAAPEDLRRFREELQNFSATQVEASPDESVEALTPRLNAAATDLRNAQAELDKLRSDAQTRRDRRAQLAELIDAANKNIAEVETALNAPEPPGLPASQVNARRTLLVIRRAAYRAEIRAFEEELRELTARADVFEARRELQRRIVEDRQQAVNAWQKLVDERREGEIRAQHQEVQREIEQAPAPVRQVANQTADLVAERGRIGDRLKELTTRINELDEQQRDFSVLFEKVQKNVAEAAFSELVGPEVARLRRRIVELRANERDAIELREEFARALSRQIELDEQRSDLHNVAPRAAELLALIERDGGTSAAMEQRVLDLLRSQRAALDQLFADYLVYVDRLGEYRRRQSALLAQVSSASQFVERSSLWLRSHPQIGRSRWPSDVWDWRSRLRTLNLLASDILAAPIPWGLAIAAMLVLLGFRSRFRRGLVQTGEQTGNPATDHFSLTLKASAYTLLLSAPVPVLLWFLGWRLSMVVDLEDPSIGDFAHALGASLLGASRLAIPLELIWHTCRPGGLADRHFRIDVSSVERVRFSFVGIIPLAVLVAVISGVAQRSSEVDWQDGPARVGFAVFCALMFVVLERLMRPTKGVFANRLRRSPNSLLYQTRWVWYLMIVSIPIVLLTASLIGYHYTAVELLRRLVLSVWVLIAVLAAQWLAMRAVFVAQRRLALRQARERREAAAAARAAEKAADAAETPAVVAVAQQPEPANIAAVGAQTQQVLRSASILVLAIGLWFTWRDLLPALDFLNQYQLGFVQVTAGALVLGVFYGVLTVILAKNIPGLLEITLLPRLPLDRGVRYAVVTIARYVITLVGLGLTFGALGISWNSIQWLAAGVSVGLGFGLQEIFANFICGLILLFERPIRVGDVVSIGGTDGIVTRIRIRATTILNWERKEMIIPNKELITGRVLNWTLSDRVLRVLIKISVARGSDPRRVQQILEELARSDSRIANEPVPAAVFVGFGGSSLDFELRCFVKDLDYSVSTQHDLHNSINHRFREAGIQLAYPVQVNAMFANPQDGIYEAFLDARSAQERM